MAAYQAHMDMEKERLAIVEEERQKLIQKHAEKLLGFLPRVRQTRARKGNNQQRNQ